MKRFLLALLTVAVLAIGLVLWLGLREDDSHPSTTPDVASAELVARGAYLARAGNCIGCHTARGGQPYAGGRAIQTPFGAIYASNITPDRETGIGAWSADDFWRALHNGKSRDGSLLYPAFPFPNYSRVTRADSDAIYAYLQSVPAVRQINRAPELDFPFNQRWLLVGWRALYFRPEVYQPQPAQSAEWNRGAYLVQGLGHCSACHTARNVFGAQRQELSGGIIPMVNWYATSLTGEHGAREWPLEDLIAFMGTGVSMQGSASGPMAEVVRDSLQHLQDDDLHAIAVYLKSLPPDEVTPSAEQPLPGPEHKAFLQRGARVYEKHCVDCHGADGRGEPPHFPPLAGNRSVLVPVPVNPIRLLVHGGYPPSTEGNPYPFGMPPFGNLLTDEEAAAVLSYIRNAWGNRASVVASPQINRLRPVMID
ncbi:MAG TPA: cytochrome c [Noviherbaspirillum sp.]|nr:cytochrome c [Noviherbaspirillum sp.]